MVFKGIYVVFVSVCGGECVEVSIGNMEFYDSDDDFCLTQTPSKEFCETNSYSYGSSLLDNDDGNQGTSSGIVSWRMFPMSPLSTWAWTYHSGLMGKNIFMTMLK